MESLFTLAYLAAAVLFIVGLGGLAHPKTARQGNNAAMAGMAIAIITTLLMPGIHNFGWIFAGLVLGACIGIPIARSIAMTALPQLVALFHSFVGLAAVLVAGGMFVNEQAAGTLNTVLMIELFMGAWIGALTFSGSVLAFCKLQGIVSGKPVQFAGQHYVNLGIALAMLAFGIVFVATESFAAFSVMVLLALVLGVTLILPIGGADMPVVVSMLNSYSGWAAAATGFTLANTLLIITGALVGASGAILSYIMCTAMNRSFINVILGGIGGGDTSAVNASASGKPIREAGVEDMAFLMSNAQRVIIVPGYGMAVAQAQHAMKEVMQTLQEKDVNVKFAIHPVAGRMPGHMNVLLAEADVPYDAVEEMEEINPSFPQTDVVLVMGANDVVNPDAKTTPGSPLYGMPILEAYRAKQVYVVKRSMRAGYSGVENALFTYDNCALVFGDAKHVAEKLSQALKASH